MFHNTTNENQVEVQQMTINNAKQEEVIITIFAQHKKLSPTQAHNFYKTITGKYKTPLTSIRRAISNLTNQDRLVLTTEKIKGVFGKSECVWEFRTLHSSKVDTERSVTRKPKPEMVKETQKAELLKMVSSLYSDMDRMVPIEIKNTLLDIHAKVKQL